MAGDFRVTTYEVQSGVFTGTSYTLTLDQNLVANYFCLITPGGPDETGSAMARVDGDPFGTGGLNTSTNPDELDFVRHESTAGDWVGMITVVECIANPTTAGFTLQDVLVSTMTAPVSTGTQTSSFSSAANLTASTVPFGGVRGGGVTVNTATGTDRREYFAKFDIDIANDELDISRRVADTDDVENTTYTTYLVEWGSDWNVQTLAFDGIPPDNELDQSEDYYTEELTTSVLPRNSWVWGSGIGDDNTNTSGYQSQNFSLNLADEYTGSFKTKRVGVQNSFTNIDVLATVYVMESPNILVERLIVDSTSSTSGTITNDISPNVTETYTNTGSLQKTVGERLNFYFSSDRNGNPITPLVGTVLFEQLRNTSATTISWSRSGTGNLDFLVYAVDFAGGAAGDGESAAVLNQTDYVSTEKGGTATVLNQTDYISNQVGGTAGVLVQVDYSPPPEQNSTASVSLQSETEYTAANTTGSVGAQIEWDGPPASGDSQVPSVAALSSTTTSDNGNVTSIALESSATPSDTGNLDSVALSSATRISPRGFVDSVGLSNSMTPEDDGQLGAIYLQVAVTNPQPLAGGDEDIQGEYYKKRFNSFYKR